MNGVPAEQQAPPPAEAASTETWLKGHVGHLTGEEELAFEEFKKLCTKQGFYTPATDRNKASHDDGTLVYILHASCLLLTANASKVAICELGNSSLKKPLLNSKTRKYGGKRTT